MDNDIFQGYKGEALDLLKKYKVRVWGTVVGGTPFPAV